MSTPFLNPETKGHFRPQILPIPPGILSYWEWPNGTEPVLLLHGLADHGRVWAQVADSLGQPFHCIAPDLRGHGDSSKPSHGYRCAEMISDLTMLIDHLGWPSTHVVAHSWSAKVAAVWAQQQPHRLRSLTLVDPFFINRLPNWMRLTFPILYRVLPFLKMMGPFETYEHAKQQARQLKQYRGWNLFHHQLLEWSMEQKPDGRWGSKFVAQARDEIFVDVLQVAGLTQPIFIPTLLILPQGGINRTAWQLQPYHTFIRSLQIQKVPGSHWCFLDEPQVFIQAIATFLAGQMDNSSDPG